MTEDITAVYRNKIEAPNGRLVDPQEAKNAIKQNYEQLAEYWSPMIDAVGDRFLQAFEKHVDATTLVGYYHCWDLSFLQAYYLVGKNKEPHEDHGKYELTFCGGFKNRPIAIFGESIPIVSLGVNYDGNDVAFQPQPRAEKRMPRNKSLLERLGLKKSKRDPLADELVSRMSTFPLAERKYGAIIHIDTDEQKRPIKINIVDGRLETFVQEIYRGLQQSLPAGYSGLKPQSVVELEKLIENRFEP